MRELRESAGRCANCGAGAEAEVAEGSLAARAFASLFAAEARARSGLAYAAGFAGIVYLFKPSLLALAGAWLGVPGALLAYLWGWSAPAAMALGLCAASELDHAPRKAGRAQALLGFLVGLWGTLHLLAETLSWWRFLRW